MSVQYKLLGAMVGITAATLIVTLILARWSFDAGFLDYINAREIQRLENLAQRLADQYQSYGTWPSSLESALLSEIERSSMQSHRPPPPHPPGTRPPGHDRPPREHPPGLRPGPDRHRERRKPPPPAMPATVLLSTTGSPVAGDPDIIQQQHLAVDVLVEGIAVGILAAPAQVRLSGGTELGFSAQQFNISIVVALAALAVSMLVAIVLARALVRPIRQSQQAVRTLREGNYEVAPTPATRDELGELMIDLGRLAETLRANQASRQTFIADVSHELRTPVSVIRAEVDSMLDGIRPYDRDSLISLSEEVQRLNKLIDDLHQLSLSDVGGLRYTFADTNLAEVMQACLDSLHFPEAMTVTKSLNDVSLRADADRLHQLFVILLNNAIAYTDLPGKLSVEVHVADANAVVKVDDSPPGVSEEDAALLFEPLFRADRSRSRAREGAGLGLSIASRIVEAHSGTITLVPSQLGGVAIEVRLPL